MPVNILDKVGSVGALIAGAAVPCCFLFPSLVRFDTWAEFSGAYECVLMYALQGMVLLALVGSFIAFRGHRKAAPIFLSVVSTASKLYGINSDLNIYFIYGGMIGLLAVAVWNSIGQFERAGCKELLGLGSDIAKRRRAHRRQGHKIHSGRTCRANSHSRSNLSSHDTYPAR